jgi:DNA-binding NtrC family response regulator
MRPFRYDRKELAKAIVECEGSVYRAAFWLGLSRSTLYYHIKTRKLWPVVHRARKLAHMREKELEKHALS